MTLELRAAGATDAYKLGLLDRTPGDAPCWVSEVETWVTRDAWFWYRDDSHQAVLLIVEDDLEIVGVVGYQRVVADE